MSIRRTGDSINIPGFIVVDSIEHLSTITEAKEPIRPKGSYYDDIKKCFNEIFPDYDPPRYIPPKYPSLSLLHWNSVPVYKMPFLKLLTEMSKTKTKETDMKHDFTVVEGIDMMLCKEGTTFWALAQMKKGFKVWQPKTKNIFDYDESCYYPIRQKDKSGTMINTHTENNFIKEFSDTFEIYREAKFKAGDWVKNIYSNDVLFIEEVDHTNYRYLVRLLGCKSRDEHAFSTLHGFYELYSLKPDFSEAEEGDQAFAYGFGKATIAEIREKNFYKIIACSEKFRRAYTNLGRDYSTDAHPLLFHSHDQAENYYKEVAYQDRLKDETDSN